MIQKLIRNLWFQKQSGIILKIKITNGVNMNKDNSKVDKGLQGNEKIEEAIVTLQSQSTPELLAHALTVIRRRMKEQGQLIIAVEPSPLSNEMNVQAVKTSDGKNWWVAFTGFDEELKGGDSVKSTFLTDMDKLFQSALTVDEIEGVIINPWNRTIMLNKRLISIILGTADN